jgi:hypothetical protein
MATKIRVRICARGGDFCQVGLSNCCRVIFHVLPKLDSQCKLDLGLATELCQIVGDELFLLGIYF